MENGKRVYDKRMTHDEFCNKLKDLGIKSYPMERYEGVSKKIMFHCECGNESIRNPRNVLDGLKCRKCRVEIHKCLTMADYMKKLNDADINIVPIEEYTRATTPIRHKCSCGNTFLARPTDIVRGKTCPNCENFYKSEKMLEEGNVKYLEKLKEKNIKVYPTEAYKGATTKIHHCCVCGGDYFTTPAHVLMGCLCKQCAIKTTSDKNRTTNDDYLKLIEDNHLDARPTEYFLGMDISINHRCTCGNIWKVKPMDIIRRNSHCWKCSYEIRAEMMRLTNGEYLEKLENNDIDVKPLEKYIDSRTPIKHLCSCGNEWMVKPLKVLQGHHCGKCTQSKGEKKIDRILSSKNILHDSQKTFDDLFDIGKLRFDFYLPVENILIEFQGQQHSYPIDFFGGEEAFVKLKHRDNLKKEYCRNNNIRLLEINYNEFDDIREIIENFITSKEVNRYVN